MAGRPRITGGELRGRPLPQPVPAGARPTSSRVREALFSILGQDLDGMRILDAYGGSGLLGFEAASRGADVVIAERNLKAAKAIAANARELGLRLTVARGDVLKLSATLGVFDGALVDPPYALDVGPILAGLEGLVSHWLLLEAQGRTEVPELVGRLALERTRNYGGTALHLYRVKEA